MNTLVTGGHAEDVYPLSPLQEGILFHSLYAPESGVPVEQLSCALDGPRSYAGRLILFRPLDSPHPANGWGARTRQPVEMYEMPADHDSPLMPPVVAALAERLRSSLGRGLGEARRSAPVEPPVALSSVPEARR